MQTYPIPGGTASFREQKEMTTGQQRSIARAQRKMRKDAITSSTAITVNGQPVTQDTPEADIQAAVLADPSRDMAGLPIDLDQADVEAIWEFNDTLILVSLADWTIDEPLPTTLEEITGLHSDLYDALQDAVAKQQRVDDQEEKAHGFGVDAVTDPTSPTEASSV